MPKFIKTSERLPDKEGEYFIKFKTDIEFIVKDVKYFWLDGDEEDKQEVRDFWENTIEEWLDESEEEINNIVEQVVKLNMQPEAEKLKLFEGMILYWSANYGNKEEFDKMFNITCKREGIIEASVKEITDTMRLDWLCLNDYNVQTLESFSSMYAIDNNSVREFIDKQLKQE